MMRITNSMMLTNTKENINSNKVNVDRLNTQMSTQKKITKPSDNPLIAIKSLRLSTTLSQINQYYSNNIKDADSWMDITETALTNMKSIVNDAYRLCVNGATDTLTNEDRNTILTQLKSYSSQLYGEANSDYAGRTVFSGYKTNETVAFTDYSEATTAKYEVTERLSYTDIQENNYYANEVTTPGGNDVTAAIGLPNSADYTKTPQQVTLKRVRLSYDALKNIANFTYSARVDTSSSKVDGTTNGVATIRTQVDKATGVNAQVLEWKSQEKDSTFTYLTDSTGNMDQAGFEDLDGNKLTIKLDGTSATKIDVSYDTTKLTKTSKKNNVSETDTYTDGEGKVAFTVRYVKDAGGNYTSATIKDSAGNTVTIKYDGGEVKTIEDAQGNTIEIKPQPGTLMDAEGNPVTDAGGNPITTNNVVIKNADGDVAMTAKFYDNEETAGGATLTHKAVQLYTEDKKLGTDLVVKNMTATEFDQFLSDVASGAVSLDDYQNTVICLPDSGEMIIGSNLAANLTSEHADLQITYNKEGFKVGEVRPEMYFNCVKQTEASTDNWVKYTNYDADGNWIYQNIDYAISSNQELTVNTQIKTVIDADCYRDMAEMTDMVQKAIDAHTVVTNLENMISSTDYVSDKEQLYLKDALAKAKKQADYMDDNLQKLFGRQISNFEKYLNDINLAITDVGSRGDQLALAENRMGNSKTTFTELKSNNEDEELSDVTINYTAAYNAYQASLQAAGKIDDMSLLDFL